MAHCNPQMSDFVAQTPPGVNGSVYVKTIDTWDSGVSTGDGCISNGTYVACAYRQSWNALTVFNGNGNIVWGSRSLLDNRTYSGLPIMQADGSVVAGDDQHIYKFNSDGSVAWSTPTPGGTPIGLVPTPNGAVVAATLGQTVTQCWQANCTLSFTVTNGGSGYTTASVLLSGGYCPGASAIATVSNGAVTAVTAVSQGTGCEVAPDAIVLGDGIGASASAVLTLAAPMTVYNGNGAVVGSTYLYQTGTNGPYYQTINTPCVNNGSYPNRLYVLTNLKSDQTQGALWALDIDPTNLTTPVTPAWNVAIHGPSGASPLCVGNNIYFDGAGIAPGDNVGTTIFGVQDDGSSGSFLFQVPLGPEAGKVTCNFALDPRSVGGFWHQLQYSPNIYHRSGATGALIQAINVSNLLTAAGAPDSTYWQAGIFTTYGSTRQPYLMLPEAPKGGSLGYLAMLNLNTSQLAWTVPLAGNDASVNDTVGGDAALVLDSNQNPVLVMEGKQTGAYFITNGGADASVSPQSLGFGPQMTGTTSGTQVVTLYNNASAPLNIGSISAGGPFSATNNCGATMASGVSCTISVTFSPNVAGIQNGAVAITSNSQFSPLTVPLTGTGTASAPVAVLSANQLTFPPQAAGTISPPQAVTLQNNGPGGLAIASIAASGAAAQTNSCPTNLAAGASCTINVMLAAPLTGACSGSVTVSSNASGGAQTTSVGGTCTTTPSIESALSTSSLVFEPQTAGTTSATQSVTLSNIGTLALNIASIVASGAVSQTNTCGSVLGVGANCAITITFSPTATGLQSGSVTVSDAAPDSPHVISISGVGMPNPVPIVNQPLLPASFQPGAGGRTLTVYGSGFVPGSVVYWNGTPRVTQSIGSAQLSASLTAADLAVPRTGWVSVVNPTPGGGQSNVVWLPVGYPSPAPVFTNSAIPASSTPSALTTADFNNDGNLDLAVANSGANTVSILPGNGNGVFTAKADYATGNAPSAVAVGDFNHDGILDLAVANQADNTVSILLGAGGGVFNSQTVYATGNQPSAVVVADLNGDGNLDLAVANRSDNTVSILLGKGDGTFAVHVDYPAGESPAALTAADFNNDGKPDLAVANDITPGGTVTILLNHGDGSYLPGVAYATGDSTSVVAADLSGDGILDFAAVNSLDQTLSVYLGTGNGTFTLGPTQATLRLAPNPVALAAADVDGDGTLELLLSGNSDSGLTVLTNNYAASFSPTLQYGGVSGATAVATGDFNNDGSIDVAVVVPASNTISVLLQSPAIGLSSSSLNFGNVLVGGIGSQTVALINDGSAVLRISTVGAGGRFTQTNTCTGRVIVPGYGCTITVTFSPTAAGTQSGVLTISANVPGGRQTVTLSGVGVTFTASISLPVNSVIGGNSLASNTVAVSSPAPAGGWTVNLSSSSPAVAAVPASVQVAAGTTTSSSFTIATTAVSSSTRVTITASVNGSTATATVTVNPIGVSFKYANSNVYGGAPATNSLTLASPAPAGGLVFYLSTANPAIASVPASVTVPAGASASPNFNITTTGVATSTSVDILASLSGVNGAIAIAYLQVRPAQVSTVTLTPTSVTSGLSTTANVVNLAGVAPPGGIIVSLASSKPSVAAVPSIVTVPANASTSQPFTITAGYVTVNTPVTITATLYGVNAVATLTVTPDSVASVNLAAATLVGGEGTATNTVTLLAPSPPAGATVYLSSSNPTVAAVTPMVTVSAGATTSSAFNIVTTPVTVSTPVIVTAKYNGILVPVTLTVIPLAVSSVNLAQAGTVGGKTVTGNSVGLNAAAPSGGVTVSLSSSNPTVASVPATVTVAAGSHVSATFSITTTMVTKQTTVTITAAYQGSTATANFNVGP